MFNSRNASTQTGQDDDEEESTDRLYVDVRNLFSGIDVFTCPSILECPICKAYAMAPIYQCSNGHIMCSRCRALITTCPTCLIKMGGLIRNRQIEKIAEVMPFPCKYNQMGCRSLQPYKELAEHEKYCNFRPVTCPHRRSCEWIGPLSKLVDHLATDKLKLIKIFNGDSIKFPAAWALNPSRLSEWRMVQCCFGKSFMFILLRDYHEGAITFFALVNILDTKKESEKFTYSLELTSGNGTSMTWKGSPIPYHDGVLTTIQQSKCLVFDAYSARNFAKNGVLTFDVNIFEKTHKIISPICKLQSPVIT